MTHAVYCEGPSSLGVGGGGWGWGGDKPKRGGTIIPVYKWHTQFTVKAYPAWGWGEEGGGGEGINQKEEALLFQSTNDTLSKRSKKQKHKNTPKFRTDCPGP